MINSIGKSISKFKLSYLIRIDYAYLITMFSIVFATSSALSVTVSRYSRTDFTLMILIGSLLSKN